MLPRFCVIAGMVAALALGPPARAADTPQRDALAAPAPASTPTADAPAAPPTPVNPAAAKPHQQNAIVALVNDRPITSYELRQRINLVMATSNIPRTPEMEKKVREQVLEQLETELLQREEAGKNDVTVSAPEVDRYLQNILNENHMTADQLKEVLTRGHVQMATFRAQLAAQILWQKAVQERYAGRVNISKEAVDAELARIAEGANRAHFLVSEIFLPVDNPDLDDKVRKDAENLVAQLQAGAQFAAVARQFSQSASAAEGGDMGLVYDGQLAPEINKVLETMKTGDMSPPVRSFSGYYILLLRQRLEPADTQIIETEPSAANLPESLPLGRLLLPTPPKPPQDYLEKLMAMAEQLRSVITSCDIAAKMPERLPGARYFPLGTMRLADLNQQTRDALAKTESGGVAPPFRSDVGIELFVRCDKAVVKKIPYRLPTREQVEQQLFDDQISALARRYNRDLRRNADIEVR